MKLHRRRQQSMKMFPLRSTRLHSKRHQFQKLQRFHLWQSVWRSGALHQVPDTPTIPFVAKRWRSPVSTTTPPQLRWRAGVLRALRQFRRIRDRQSDPSEVSLKRSRLAPAQVVSTALAKNCDWSLGFDGRGPMFDEINHQVLAPLDFFSQDVRQEKRSILLQSLQRISCCCLRPWNVNGRNGRSARQHCH